MGIFANKKKNQINTLEEKSTIWQEYPRPQLRRDSYISLNGTWKIGKKAITVPFCPESNLSGYEGHVYQHLIYEKEFVLRSTVCAAGKNSMRTILHFGAVDQICEVYLNGEYVGRHIGGYLPFSFDITEMVYGDSEVNSLIVKVMDNFSHKYPYGKQSRVSHGMWYTGVSGIWKSVWIEQVPKVYITKLRITPDEKGFQYTAWLNTESEGEGEVCVGLDNGEEIRIKSYISRDTFTGYVDLTGHKTPNGDCYEVRMWNPDDPYLYDLTFSYGEDVVKSYAAIRTIEKKEINGIPRVCLNGEPILIKGVLDQGYYIDGHYLPSDEKGYEADILRMKELGFNLLRKHIKIEPEAFYYACDRMGMLVMQDMVQSGHYSLVFDTLIPNITKKKRSDFWQPGMPSRKRFFEQHMEESVEHLYNHPCIVMWTLFNEGWGQFQTDRLYEKMKSLDRTRLIDSASGWFEQHKSDFISEHIYYKNQDMRTGENPLLLSECGGFSMVIPGHVWRDKGGYGYGKCDSKEQLMAEIRNMFEGMVGPYIRKGLCGFVYTQLSDVENEINGLYSYDREVCKVDVAIMNECMNGLDAIFVETLG